MKQHRVVPTFVNVGPGRCGTSWLHEALAAHPEIGMSRVKETEYFNTNLEKGGAWYLEHFDDLDGKQAVGEISNNYYLDTSIPEKLLAHNPDIKVIFNVRDPMGLLKSFHQFGVRRGLPFEGGKDEFDIPVGMVMGSGYAHRKRQNALVPSDTPTLVESVLLSRYLDPYIKAFPPENLYVFDFERLRTDPQGEIERIYTFLGVDPSFKFESAGEKINAALKPKSKALARSASATAFFLRRAGLHRLLSHLHKSRFLKTVIFKPAEKSAMAAFSPPAEIKSLLAEERARIVGLRPELSGNWEQAGLL